MRKSNWSDLLSAFAMSARESVLRLFESAIMNARAVISAMKTAVILDAQYVENTKSRMGTYSRKPCRTGSELQSRKTARRSYMISSQPTICRYHLCVLRSSERHVANWSWSCVRTYLDLGITLHDFLDPCERERGMAVVGCFLLSSIDLSLPEGRKKVI